MNESVEICNKMYRGRGGGRVCEYWTVGNFSFLLSADRGKRVKEVVMVQ